jgi:glycosyltransferase involved in cell wall biosynthesis
MHVAFLIPTIDRIGGAEQQVILLAKGLSDRGWRVTVIALSGSGGDAATKLQSQGIGFLSLHMRKGLADPRGWSQFHHWMKLHEPEVLHAHLPHAVLFARWSRFAAPVRVLIETIHSPATGGPLRYLGYCASTRQPDAITAVSRAAAEPWLAAGLFDEKKLSVIPNGVDIDHWKSDRDVRIAARQELGFSDEFVWLTVGRLDPVKDHSTLLLAFATLPANARLLIAGIGPLERDLRRLAVRLGIGRWVQFLGFEPDVLRWMQLADAFVLCSQWEGLPMALLEAAACELPTVLSDIPAIRELIPASVFLPMVPVGDADALGAAMNATMHLWELERCTLSMQMRQFVAERFSLASALDKWENFYHAHLDLKPQPTRSAGAESFRNRKERGSPAFNTERPG